jgi:hypothetical protein
MIPLQASVKEIEEELRDRFRWPSYEYLQDHHFQHHVATQLTTVDEALEFADLLEAECAHGCAKARQIKHYLVTGENAEFWSEGIRFRSVIAFVRRTHCWSHEAGSYFRERD